MTDKPLLSMAPGKGILSVDTLPALRTDIELISVRLGGGDAILVRDPMGIVEPNTALSGAVAPFLPLFDGSSTVDDLRIAMMRIRGGSLVYRSEAERVVEELSRLGILQTEGYRGARERIVREFLASPERTAALAGSAYPADPQALVALLDRILSPPVLPAAAPPSSPVCALASPHIDLRVAERTYSAAYRAVRGEAPSAVLLLGTGHSLGSTRYCLSAKTFATPLGRVPADREAVEEIRGKAEEALAPDDFAHRAEHSIEFPLLFLQRIFPMESIPVLPVLCGQMEDLFGQVRSPLDAPGVGPFVEALSAWLSAPPGAKLVAAGVDLSHVGPKFGDPLPAASLEPAFRAFDGRILAALEAGDAAALFEAGAREKNRYRVCGFSALWTLLAVAPEIRGTVLDYGVWHEESTRSAVSFAAVAFTRQPSGTPCVRRAIFR